MAADYSTGAALFLFFLVTLLINPLAKLLTGTSLHTGELATVYIMMIVGAAIPSWGLTMNLIPLLGGFFYYATPENDWANIIQPYIARFFVPEDSAAIQKLFEGNAQGERIPWGAWATPLIAWGLFVVNMYFTTLCVLVVLRKQWVERERLNFPLATLPIEMSARAKDQAVAPFYRNYLTWVGFAIPALIGSVNALHRYFNFVPQIDLNLWVPLLRRSIWVNFRPHFEVVGLSYLLNLDISMGVWFFAFLNMVAIGLCRMTGWNIGPEQPYSSPSPPSVAHIALGALFFLVLSSLWSGRQHLRQVWRKALRGDDSIDDSGELLPYRVAVFGFIVSFLLGLFALYATNMNLPTAFVFQLSALVIFVGLARIISQAGLAYCRAPVAPAVFTVNTLGSASVGAPGLTALALNFPWSADIRTFVMASAATGLKLAEGDPPGVSALVLGHCRGHCRHYGRLHHRSHPPRVHLWGHQPEQLAVRLYDDLYRQLDYQQPQQPPTHPRLAFVLCRPRRVLDGPVDIYQKPLRRLSHSPHRLGHRAAASCGANLAVGLYGLAA